MQLFQRPVQDRSRCSQLLLPREAIGAQAQPFTASVGDDIALCRLYRKIPGIPMSNREKCAVVGIAANCVYACIGKITLQLIELFSSVVAQSFHTHGQRKLLPAACLVVGEHRRRRFEKGVASCTQQWRIRPLIAK